MSTTYNELVSMTIFLGLAGLVVPDPESKYCMEMKETGPRKGGVSIGSANV